MSILLNGDCLEELKDLDDNSIDLIFCDLPYGQTNCAWDIIIPWEPFWKEIMRVKKLHTPMFFTTTTKFGVQLINSAPKKLKFFDLVWVKSASTGFLLSKKFPLRKHEMVYGFYEKLPFYDLSSHKHKFLKEGKKSEGQMIKEKDNNNKEEQIYDKQYLEKKIDFKDRKGEAIYDPPLPTTIVKEEDKYSNGSINSNTYDIPNKSKGGMYRSPAGQYDPPLPTTIVKEEDKEGLTYKPSFSQKDNADNEYRKMGRKGGESAYEPPLPNSLLEIKSTRGKHSTEKPVALMEWLLKYYSKEGDTVLDPTMGSGSTGVACRNMKRNFIGIEKDPEIYEVAVNRIEE